MEYTLILELIADYGLSDDEFLKVSERCKEKPIEFGHKDFRAQNGVKASEMAENYAKNMLDKHNEQCGCGAWDYQVFVAESDSVPI